MLEGLLAPLRVVLHRSFADWLIVAATWLVIVCATTLLAIGVLYGDAVSLSGLRQLIAAQPITSTSLVVDMRVAPDELSEVDEVIGHQVGRVLGWTDGELARIISSGTYDLAGAVPDVAETDLTVFAAADRLDRHATVVEGTWPASGRAAGGGDLDRRRGAGRHRCRRRADADEPRGRGADDRRADRRALGAERSGRSVLARGRAGAHRREAGRRPSTSTGRWS